MTAGGDFWMAHAGCRALGGELASVTSNIEQGILINMIIAEDNPADNYLIGLNDIRSEGDYVWTDGDVSTFDGFCSGEPSGGSEDCVVLRPSCSGWNDVQCSNEYRAICKVAEIVSGGTKFSSCFHLSSVVRSVTRGPVAMGSVAVGDVVTTLDAPGGNQVSSAVLAILHHSTDTPARFLSITTASGGRVEVSGSHGIYGYPGGRRGRYMLAEELRQGDYLLTADGDMEGILAIQQVSKTGYIAVLTEHGSILADGVFASCYASVKEHYLADLAMAPMKMLYKIAMKLGFPLRSSSEEMWYTKVFATLYTTLFASPFNL